MSSVMDKEYDLLYNRVNTVEAQINKMETRCCLQHPVNLSEKITVCEINIKDVKTQTDKLIIEIKDKFNENKDNFNEVNDKIEKIKNDIHEMSGKINSLGISLTDITNTKIKKYNNLTSLWVTIIGTIVATLICGLIAYFFMVHSSYQQQKMYENFINNNRTVQK